MTYTVVPVFLESDPRSKGGNGPIGAAGDYIVAFRLGIPGVQVAINDFHFESFEETGNSLIQAPANVVRLVVDFMASPDAPSEQLLTLGVNPEHRLSSATVKCRADNFEHAAALAHDLVMPFLSHLAYSHEVGITTTGCKIVEVATSAQRLTQITIGATKEMAFNQVVSTPELRRLLASYREGLSSCEPLYQALSFYKVVEGVLSMRGIEDQELRARGETLNRELERIPHNITTLLHPADAALNGAFFSPFLGQKFTTVRDTLRDSLRHNISHMNFDALPFGADSYADVVAVQKALPVLRYMARVLLSSVVPTDNSSTESTS